MQFEYLETNRMRLRKIGPKEITYFFTHLCEPEIKKEMGLQTDAEFLKEKNRFKYGIESFNRTARNFQLMDKNTGLIIGFCGFHNWCLDHKRAEIGYVMNLEEFKNKGLMKEALKRVIRHGFEEMDLHRMEACIGPENTYSKKLIQANNFSKEGYLREHYHRDNKIYDSEIYSLLKKEWNPIP